VAIPKGGPPTARDLHTDDAEDAQTEAHTDDFNGRDRLLSAIKNLANNKVLGTETRIG